MIMAEAAARRARQQHQTEKIRVTASTNLATGTTSTGQHHGRHLLSHPTTELTGDTHTAGRIFAKPTTALPPRTSFEDWATWICPICPNNSVSGEEARASLEILADHRL